MKNLRGSEYFPYPLYFQWALMLFTYPCPNVFSCTMCAQERIMQKWDSVMSWVWLHPWHMIFQERHLWLQQCQIYSFWRCVREVFLGQHSVSSDEEQNIMIRCSKLYRPGRGFWRSYGCNREPLHPASSIRREPVMRLLGATANEHCGLSIWALTRRIIVLTSQFTQSARG